MSVSGCFQAKERCTVLATVENLFPYILIKVTIPSGLLFKTENRAQSILLLTMEMGSVCVENPQLVN